MRSLAPVAALLLSLAAACGGSGVAPSSPGAGGQGGLVDAGVPDAGAPDAGTADAGTPDAGTPDAGTPDAGTPDAGTPDAGTPDAGTPDAGTGVPPGALTQFTAGEGAANIAIDAVNVYWTIYDSSRGVSTVRFAPKAGGAPRQLGAVSGATRFVASDGAALFLATSAQQIDRISLSDGRAITLSFDAGGGQFGMDDQAIYFMASTLGSSTASVVKVAKTGGGETVLAPNVRGGAGLTAALGQVFWTGDSSSGGGSIFAVPTSGGRVRTVTGPAANPQRLRVQDGLLLFRSYPDFAGDGTIMTADPNGGPATQLSYQLDGSPPDIDGNSSVVYWNEPWCVAFKNNDGTGGGCVDSTPKFGNIQYTGVRVDDTAVYFIRGGDVFKRTKG